MQRPIRSLAMLASVPLALVAYAVAGVPDRVAFQGRLLDGSGMPLDVPTTVHFRVLRGGDGATWPSSGSTVYHERALVDPGPTGIFAHFIGSGTPESDCAGGACELGSQTLGDGSLPVWIEVTLDPDGVPGSGDEEPLLPRTRVGTVGYAYRVGTLDGAEAGSLTGALEVDTLQARDGAVLGDGTSSEVALTFDGSTGGAALTWDGAAEELAFSAPTRHLEGLGSSPERSLAFGPLDNPVADTYLRFGHYSYVGADGNLDGIPDLTHNFNLCYNCREGSPAVERASEYAMFSRWAMTESTAPGDRRVVHTWTFVSPGQPTYWPFRFDLRTDVEDAYDAPDATFTFRTSRDHTALNINRNGNVMVGNGGSAPQYPLDVFGTLRATGDLRFESGSALRVGPLAAIEDDPANGRLIVGRGFPKLQLGDGIQSYEIVIDEVTQPNARINWNATSREFELSARTRFDEGVVLPGNRAVNVGPFANPVPGTYVRWRTNTTPFADGNLDGTPDDDIVTGVCYNCAESFTGPPQVPEEYSMKAQWEWTYAPTPGERWVEHNWDFLATGLSTFRPFGFYLRTDRAGGFAQPNVEWNFKTDRQTTALFMHRNGNVAIGSNPPFPTHRLEVYGDLRVTGAIVGQADQPLRFGDHAALQGDAEGERLELGAGFGQVALGATSLLLGSCLDAAAAPVVEIGACNVVGLTGPGPVESLSPCTPSQRGRTLHVLCGTDPTLLCDGDGSRCSGGNLRLTGTAADFTCTADDVLTLLCDGAAWRQVAASIN